MNFLRASGLLCLLLLTIFGCKDNDLTPDTCKLTVIDRGNGNKHTDTYDAQGRISQMTREFDGTGSGTISRFIYSFTYNTDGQLTKSTITLDGQPYGTEIYTYTNKQITKAAYTNADGSKGVNNIKYNAAGLITEFTFESGDPNSDGKQYFEYNTDGVMTRRGYADLQGNTFFEVIIKPVGTVKSPEQLLAKHGLPYDLLTGFSWAVAEGDVGTMTEVFFLDDQTNKLVSDGTNKTTAVKTNAKGYLIEKTSIDNTKRSSTQLFTLSDCN